MRPGHRLILSLATAAGLALVVASAVLAQPASAPQQVFISPMGEPFRAPEGQPYPSVTWFAGADANHDGLLTKEEFRADALRFFKVLDLNHDDRLNDYEMQYYEYRIAPEIVASSYDTSDQSLQKPGDSDDVGYHNTPLSQVRQGAANYSFLGEAEPVRSADTDFNMKVTLEEWMAAADRRFKILDPEGKGALRFADLPPTPAQGRKKP